MSDSSTLSFRVEDDIIDALDQSAADSRASRSKIAREALLIGVEQLTGEDGDVSVPEHVAHDAKIKRLIDQNKQIRRAGKFRSEFASQLKTSFERNEHPDEFKKSVAGYIEEAEDMGELPEGVQEETGCETYHEWVQDKLRYYRAAYQGQEFNHDPVEDPLGNHEGLQNAKSWVSRAEAIVNADHDVDGGTTAREKRKEMARFALEDDAVPEAIVEQAREADRPAKEVVAEAAVDLIEQDRALNEPDASNTELDS